MHVVKVTLVKVTLCHPLDVMCRLGYLREYRRNFRGQEGGFAVVPENALIFQVCLSVSLQDSWQFSVPNAFRYFLIF